MSPGVDTADPLPRQGASYLEPTAQVEKGPLSNIIGSQSLWDSDPPFRVPASYEWRVTRPKRSGTDVRLQPLFE